MSADRPESYGPPMFGLTKHPDAHTYYRYPDVMADAMVVENAASSCVAVLEERFVILRTALDDSAEVIATVVAPGTFRDRLLARITKLRSRM